MDNKKTEVIQLNKLARQLRRQSITVLGCCRKYCGGYLPFLKRNSKSLIYTLDNPHLTVSCEKNGGRYTPVTAQAAFCDSDDEMITRLEALSAGTDFLYADIELISELYLCEVFGRLYNAGLAGDEAEFLKLCGAFSYPKSFPDDLNARFEPITRIFAGNESYERLCDASKRDCRKMAAMVSCTANISAQRLCLAYLTAWEKGKELYKSVREDYDRVFPAPNVKKYAAFIIPAALFIAVLLSVIFKNAFFILLGFPLYRAVKFYTDRALCKAYSRLYIAPARYELFGKIPPESPTLCIISALLTSEADVGRLIKNAEELLNLNRTQNLEVCLLCDLKQSVKKTDSADKAIISACRDYAKNPCRNIYIVLRERQYNEKQGCYMGYERKRGAIEQLAGHFYGGTAIKGKIYGNLTITMPRYFLVLDYDTKTGIDDASALVSVAMANEPVIKDGRVQSGYGIITPLMLPSLDSCRKSGFAGIMGGEGGSDFSAYGRMYDFYHSVFSEGTFCGKGLIDARAFYDCISLPENRVLSHDILEGNILRCTAADTVFCESFPKDSAAYFSRLTRWQRGDIQNIPFIFSKKLPQTPLGKFKLFDLCVNAVCPIFVFLSLLCGSPLLSLLAVMLTVMPFLIPTGRQRRFLSGGSLASKRLSRATAELLLIPKYAADSLYALTISVFRMIRGRRLLTWVTAFEKQKGEGTARTVREFIIPCLLCLAVIALSVPENFIALVTALLCICALPVFILLDKPAEKKLTELTDRAKSELTGVVKTELEFFLTFCNEENNYLPPDNVQLYPVYKTAHRTSPTNIGMCILSLYCGYMLKLISLSELEKRLSRLLDSLDRLEKYEGHLYNWYDTRNLMPLDGFVSSVDSGNFLCCITAVRQALRGISDGTASRLSQLIKNADMGLFYDRRKGLLNIGINAKSGKKTQNLYDMLMSEARMASFYAVARGQVPPSHYKSLSRVTGRNGRYCGCLSWSGTVFEYFMPALLIPSLDGGLVKENLDYCVHCQKSAAAGFMYGISESGYYSFDSGLNYQYKAFGARGAALRPDYRFEPVYSPYSAFLMLCCEPIESYNLLCRYRQEGYYDSRYGYYEAVDLTPCRTEKNGAVKSFMAHHKGMSIAAAYNAVSGNALIDCFMSDGDMKRGYMMTQERITAGAPLFKNGKSEIPRLSREEGAEYPDNAPLLLNNGRMTLCAMKSPDKKSGIAELLWNKRRVFYPSVFGQHTSHNPFYGFSARLFDGELCYDIRSGEFMSGKAAKWQGKFRELEISETLSLCDNLPTAQFKYRIVNNSSVQRSLSLAIYMRPVLAHEKAATAHPAFSELFLSCSKDEKSGVITVKRTDRETMASTCMAIYPDSGYYVSFDRETVDITKPIFGDNLMCVPAPCVYITLPFVLKAGEAREITLSLCCTANEQAAISAVRARPLKSRYEYSASAAHILACRMLPHILLKYRNKTPKNTPKGDFSQLYKYGMDTARQTVMFYCERASDALYTVLKAARELIFAGFEINLVLVCTSDKGRCGEIEQNVSRVFAEGGNVFTLSASELSQDETACLEYLSVYTANASELDVRENAAPLYPLKTVKPLPKPRSGENGFTAEGFAISEKPPARWSKVLANPVFGMLAHYDSLGFCWAGNSALNTLNPWDNDITGRNCSMSVYLKEKDSYVDLLACCQTLFCHSSVSYKAKTEHCTCTVSAAVPQRGAAAIIRVTVKNDTSARREFTPVLSCLLSGINVTEMSDGVLCSRRLSQNEFSGYFCLEAVGNRVFYGSKSEEIKSGRFAVSPDGDSLAGGCTLDIPAKSEQSTVFILSYCSRYADKGALSRLIKEKNPLLLKGEKMRRLKLSCPDGALCELFNNYLPEQIIKGRIYARTGFYQNGGAYGFRDQLQDGMAAAYLAPAILARLIYRACTCQFEQGDVLHWHHRTEKGRMGVRTACSDDMLWLPLAACRYYEMTGDRELFKKGVRCCTAPPYNGTDIYGKVGEGKKITVAEHCMLAANYAYKTGPHGLILMGGGDWNDSFNLVGRGGKGESVWLSMFAKLVYDRLCALPDDVISPADKELLRHRSRALKENINLRAYENGYYIRAFYDDGEKLGAAGAKSCEIDLLSQAFCVLAEVDSGDRARSAVNLALSSLVDYKGGLIKLFTPPFTAEGENKVGYAAAYPAGVRENGGQYTHAAIWLCMAVERLGCPDEALKLLSMLNPALKDREIFKNEPYYLSADVYTNPDCYGRGGWSIYTGAAGWYYTAVCRLMGFDIRNGKPQSDGNRLDGTIKVIDD